MLADTLFDDGDAACCLVSELAISAQRQRRPPNADGHINTLTLMLAGSALHAAPLHSHQQFIQSSQLIMKVLVTGATGLVGTATVQHLLAKGHHVIALARSGASKKKLEDLGVQDIVEGSTKTLDILADAAAKADAVIHLAFDHDLAFSGQFKQVVEQDVAAINVMGAALAKSSSSSQPKTLIYSSGTLGTTGNDETGRVTPVEAMPRYLSVEAVEAWKAKGVRPIVVRLAPIVYGPAKNHPFITMQIETAKKQGFVAYIEDGRCEWQTVHVDDLAVLLELALTKGDSGVTMHGFENGGISTKDIAAQVARKMDLPLKSITQEQAGPHFQNLLAHIMTMGNHKSNKLTKEWTGWEPKQYGLFVRVAWVRVNSVKLFSKVGTEVLCQCRTVHSTVLSPVMSLEESKANLFLCRARLSPDFSLLAFLSLSYLDSTKPGLAANPLQYNSFYSHGGRTLAYSDAVCHIDEWQCKLLIIERCQRCPCIVLSQRRPVDAGTHGWH